MKKQPYSQIAEGLRTMAEGFDGLVALDAVASQPTTIPDEPEPVEKVIEEETPEETKDASTEVDYDKLRKDVMTITMATIKKNKEAVKNTIESFNASKLSEIVDSELLAFKSAIEVLLKGAE